MAEAGSRDVWLRAFELGARLGLFPAEAAERARERLRLARPEEVTAEAVAEWVGRSPAEVNDLLALVPLVPADTPTEILHETVLSRGSDPALARAILDPRSTPPTVPLADVDMPTARLGTPAAETPTLNPPPAPPRAKVPRQLGPYVLGEELGHGGMGIVFRARHEKLGSACAVKVMIAGEHASAEAIARFQREAATVARMGKHPNIVTVFDLGQEGALAYYAMELVEGKSLRARMREREYTPEESAAQMEKVARARHFAHGHGGIHRDLKPENIVVRELAPSEPHGASRGGEPQVMDFGLARDVSSEDRLSAAGQVMGTLGYMAPEQARGDLEAMDARTDVYALGGILYDMVTGIPPHRGNNQAVLLACILRGDIIAPRKLRPDLPRDLETIAMKALALDPSRRYASAEALAEDLARFLRREPVHARPVGRVERFVRRVRNHPLVSGLFAAVAVSFVGLGWRFLGPAWITVPVSPENARVLVNARPLRASGVVWPAGDAVVTVQADEYEAQTRTVSLTPGRRLTLDPFHLRLDHGYLTVDSDPPGAQVLVDDRPLSQVTPVERVPVRNGTYRLTLRLADHVDDTRVVSIASGDNLPVGKVKLKHEEGTLALTGNPAGMSVSVRKELAPSEPRGASRGEGKELMRLSPPVTIPLDTGVYWLVGQLKDHFERKWRIEVRAGQECGANVSLNRQLALSYETGGLVSSSPALGDVNGDGCLDCVVGSWDHRVYVIPGRRPGPVLVGWEHGRPVSAAALTRYGRLRHDGSWRALAETATGRAQTAAERGISAKLMAAQGSAARWHGYLALLAVAQGDRDRFRRAYAVYISQPQRPESLDALLSEK